MESFGCFPRRSFQLSVTETDLTRGLIPKNTGTFINSKEEAERGSLQGK